MSSRATAALGKVPSVHGSLADPARKLVRGGQRPHGAIGVLEGHGTLLLGCAVAG